MVENHISSQLANWPSQDIPFGQSWTKEWTIKELETQQQQQHKISLSFPWVSNLQNKPELTVPPVTEIRLKKTGLL